MTQSNPDRAPMQFRIQDDGGYAPQRITLRGWKGKEGTREEPAKLNRAEVESEIPDVFSAVDFSLLEDGSIEGWIELEQNFVMAPRFFEVIKDPIEVQVKAWIESPDDATAEQPEILIKQQLTVKIEDGYQVVVDNPEEGLLDLQEGPTEIPFTLKISTPNATPAANLRVRCRISEGEQPTLQGELMVDGGTTDDAGLVSMQYRTRASGSMRGGEAPGVSLQVTRVSESADQNEIEIGKITLVAAPRVTLRIEKPSLSEEPISGAALSYPPELALGGTFLLKPRAVIEVEGKRYESEKVIRDAKIFVVESDTDDPLAWSEEHQAYEFVLRSPQGPSLVSQSAPTREGVIGEPKSFLVAIDSGTGSKDLSGGAIGAALGDVMQDSNRLVGRYGPLTGPAAVADFIQGLVDRAAEAPADTLGEEIKEWPQCAARAAETYSSTINTADAFERSLTLHKYSYEMFLTNWIGFCVELFFGWFLDAAGYLARSGSEFASTGAENVRKRVSRTVGDDAVDGLSARIRKQLGDVQDFFRREVDRAERTINELTSKIQDHQRQRVDYEAAREATKEAADELAQLQRVSDPLKEALEQGKQRKGRIQYIEDEIARLAEEWRPVAGEHLRLKDQLDRARQSLSEYSQSAKRETPAVQKLIEEAQAILDEGGPRLERLTEQVESAKREIDGLTRESEEIKNSLATDPPPSEQAAAEAIEKTRLAEEAVRSKAQVAHRAQIQDIRSQAKIEELELQRSIAQIERDELSTLYRRSQDSSSELTAEQTKELLDDMHKRQTKSVEARLRQFEPVIERLSGQLEELRSKMVELFHPGHNVFKDYFTAVEEIRRTKLRLRSGDSFRLPLVSGLHGEAGEDAAKGAVSRDDAAEQLEQRLKELQLEIRNAQQGAATHTGGKLVPEDEGYFRWFLDSAASGVSMLIGVLVKVVYWTLVVLSLGGVMILFEAAKAILSRLMAAAFATSFMTIRYLADQFSFEAGKGPQHKHSAQNLDRVKGRFANDPMFTGFFMDPRTNRGSKGDLSRVLLIVAAPEVYFQGNKDRDKESLFKRFGGAYNEYYTRQRRTFELLVQRFAADALDPKGWARQQWPTVQTVAPSLDGLLSEARDYEGDFLAARDGKFTSSAARLLEGGEYTWQDIDQLIDWFVWIFGTIVRLGALIAAIALLAGSLGASAFILPGALVAADIVEVISMFVRSTFISILVHNRVIGIQEDVVVTAVLEHEERYGPQGGGASDG